MEDPFCNPSKGICVAVEGKFSFPPFTYLPIYVSTNFSSTRPYLPLFGWQSCPLSRGWLEAGGVVIVPSYPLTPPPRLLTYPCILSLGQFSSCLSHSHAFIGGFKLIVWGTITKLPIKVEAMDKNGFIIFAWILVVKVPGQPGGGIGSEEPGYTIPPTYSELPEAGQTTTSILYPDHPGETDIYPGTSSQWPEGEPEYPTQCKHTM